VDISTTTRYTRPTEVATLAEVGEMETTESVELFLKMREAEVSQARGGRGSVTNYGGTWEAHAGDHARGILCCSNTTIKVGHSFIPTGISRMTETVTEHKGEEADSPVR
jgi:hypothetical protein